MLKCKDELIRRYVMHIFFRCVTIFPYEIFVLWPHFIKQYVLKRKIRWDIHSQTRRRLKKEKKTYGTGLCKPIQRSDNDFMATDIPFFSEQWPKKWKGFFFLSKVERLNTYLFEEDEGNMDPGYYKIFIYYICRVNLVKYPNGWRVTIIFTKWKDRIKYEISLNR